MHLDRYSRAVSLFIFLALLYLAAYPMYGEPPVDMYLRLDPLVAIGTSITSRAILPSLIPGFVILLSTLLMGRVFCGHICPMGTTIDLLNKCVSNVGRRTVKTNSFEASKQFRHWKYILLIILLGAAAAGVSLIYWGSPISLATRFYGLILWPLTMLFGETALQVSSPVLVTLGFHQAVFIELPLKVFAANVFVLLFCTVIIVASGIQARFWCRNLCPSGAMFGLCSRRPLLRRDVNEDCTRCGLCIRECPTGAICEDPKTYVPAECIACNRCVETCPENAVHFRVRQSVLGLRDIEPDLGRRRIITAGAVGLVSAGMIKTNLRQTDVIGAKLPIIAEDLIRPPGALPEPEFLKRCIRCGECMKACPTNTLQPIWFKAGLDGLFSPVLVTRLAACAVNCNVCGRVCPTGAIRNLSLQEKNHAKIGSAWIVRQNCLVWEQDRKCLVCDEVCPYNALAFKPVPDRRNSVPFVLENRCIGCGWCENKCPVRGASAIRVNIIGEIRLAKGSYRTKAAELGLRFKAKDNKADQLGIETFEPAELSDPKKPFKQPTQSNDKGLPGGFITK